MNFRVDASDVENYSRKNNVQNICFAENFTNQVTSDVSSFIGHRSRR